MKKIVYAALTAAILTACSDEPVITESSQATDPMSGYIFPNSPSFKSTQSRSVSTFETDWENFQTITVPGLGTIDLPWAPNSMGTGNPNKKDVKKEDGWIMVVHTLNEAATINNYPQYIVLYNQIKGIMKVYSRFDGVAIGHNKDFWKITFDCPAQSLTNGTYSVTAPISFKHGLGYAYVSNVDPYQDMLIEKGWNYVEIPITYDPDIANRYSMHINVNGNETFEVNLGLKFNAEINGTIVSTNSSNPYDPVKNSLFKFADSAATQALEPYISKNEILGDLLKGVIGGITQGIATTPVNMIFDTFFGMFSSSQPTVQDVNLTLDGDGAITGEVTALKPTDFKSLNIPIGEGDTGLKLGTWNLSEPPTIYMHPVGVISSVVSPEYYTYDENTYTFRNSGNYNVPIVFNPQLKPHIKNYRIECTPLYRTYGGADARPYYPGDSTDVGSLGAYRNASVLPLTYPCEYTFSKNPNQQGSTLSGPYYANYAAGTVTCWHLWHKFGKPDAGRFGYNSQYYKYVYAPACNEENYIRGGGFKYDARRMYLKVSVYSEMEFEGKTFKTLETRTYKPRFEWDPVLVSKYGRLSVDDVYYYAQRDDLLRVIDNRILERK